MRVVPDPSLVWLVGPSAAGKSTWAREHFRDVEIVSSDHLRSIVGSGPADLEASPIAFDILERIASARLEAGMLTVIDTLGFDDALRHRLSAIAGRSGLPTVAVVFDTPDEVCRERNRTRDRSVPAKVLSGQFARFQAVRRELEASSWQMIAAQPIDVVDGAVATVDVPTTRTAAQAPGRIAFHLHISTFDWMEGSADRLTQVLAAAEDAGFAGVSMMDHLVQIPQVGRAWDAMLDPHIALTHAAAVTDRLRLGVLVTNVTLRPIAVLAKMLATLDNLSGGRVDCGLGAGWFRSEQEDRGIDFPGDRDRLALLEDSIGALRAFWGPGSKAWKGAKLEIENTAMYPRPIQGTIPVIVGGTGERRTLRIVAERADGCNLRTGPQLAHKLEVLAGHCAEVGRDMRELIVTVLDVTLTGTDRDHTAALVERHRGSDSSRDFRRKTRAGTTADQIRRYRELESAGVDRVYVSLMDLDGPEPVRRFGQVIAGL